MANKYFFNVPYSCTTYGRIKGYVIADDIDDVVDKINSSDFEDEEYDETGNDGYDFDCSDGDITVDQYDIYDDEYSGDDDDGGEQECEQNYTEFPSYYLAEVLFI
jgi:hypothetical protein